MILSDSFIIFWFCAVLILSFIGQGTVGFLLLSYLRKKYYPSPQEIEIQLLNRMLTQNKAELDTSREDADRLRKEQQKLVEAFITRLSK